MKINFHLLTIALVCASLLLAGPGDSANAQGSSVKFGVLAKRGADKAQEQWAATTKYLSQETGKFVRLAPLTFDEIEPAIKKGEIDYILTNSSFYCELNANYEMDAIATMINSREGKALKEFGGVLFVKADSPITSMDQIKGKNFGLVKKSSFGGGQMVQRLLLDNGIDIFKDCAEVKELQKHDTVVMAVRAGSIDAGTVRSDTLERMAAEGKIKMEDFRIINKAEGEFPFVHSTRLYPEWPLAWCSENGKALAPDIAAALKKLDADHEACKAAKIVGWSDPLDYSTVEGCLKAISYGSFAN
jgi:phosphate/phosphite/phosphonate ABC transporter binding protein